MDGALFGVCNMAGSLSGAGNTAGSLFGIGNADGFLVVIVKFAVAFRFLIQYQSYAPQSEVLLYNQLPG